MRRTLWLVCVATLLLTVANRGNAWDGRREGFILGIGGGVGQTTFQQTVNNRESDPEEKVSIVGDFKIGYAPTNRILLYFAGKTAQFRMENIFDERVTIESGFAGVGVTVFLNDDPTGVFFSAGLGKSSWQAKDDDKRDDDDLDFGEDADWDGPGLFLGVGYEFVKHFYFEGNLIVGQPVTEILHDEITTDVVTVSVTFNVLGY